MNNTEKRFGLVLKGFSETQSMHFLLAAGISVPDTGPTIDFISAAGAPKSHHFAPVNTLSAPEDIREKILDVRREMTRDSKHFYVEEIEEQFEQFLSSNLTPVVNLLLDNDLDDLEEFILNNFFRFEIDDLNVAVVPAEDLEFTSEPTEAETESSQAPSEEDSTDSESSSLTTIEINPEIDVRDGRKVEQLRPGTPVVVRLTEESAELFGSENDREKVRLPADFMEFDVGDSATEGRLRVQIQEGLQGVGEISKGSLIRLYEPESSRDEYEQQLQPFVLILVALLVLLAVFAYLVIF